MRNVIGVLVVCGLVLFNTNAAKGAEKMIEAGKIVKFNYTLTVKGEVVDSSQGKEPLEYTQGQQMIIPGLESQMAGMKVGDKKTIIVGPEDAYGIVDQQAIIEIPKDKLGGEMEPQVGMMLQMQTASGQQLPGKIVEVKDQTVVVDFNHPLAGQELKFDVEIIDVN